MSEATRVLGVRWTRARGGARWRAHHAGHALEAWTTKRYYHARFGVAPAAQRVNAWVVVRTPLTRRSWRAFLQTVVHAARVFVSLGDVARLVEGAYGVYAPALEHHADYCLDAGKTKEAETAQALQQALGQIEGTILAAMKMREFQPAAKRGAR